MPNIHPGLFLIIMGLVAAASPKKIRPFVMVGAPAVEVLIMLNMPKGLVVTIPFMNHYEMILMRLTQQNWMFLMVFSMAALVMGIYSCHVDNRLEAFSTMAYAGGSIGVVLAGDWLCMLFFWEMVAILATAVIWSNRTPQSTRAGFRYLAMHMFAGNMLLFGVVLKLYNGQFVIENIADKQDLAFYFILFGLCINAAAVPFHAWAPDAYPHGSETGSVYLSSFTTKLSVFCMLQIFTGYKPLIIIGLVMIFYGATFAMLENDMKRLLSYHIISQIGFMVTDMGMGGELGMNAGTALAFSNIIYKALLFMGVGAVIQATGIRKINQLGGLWKKMPTVFVVFFIAAWSIAGAPPLAGFTCKSLSVLTAEHLENEALVIILTLGSVATALSVLFKMVYFIFLGKDRGVEVKPIPKNMTVALVLGAAACIFVGLCPQIVYSWLPYGLDYNPYTVPHVLEYLQLFPAALIAFMMYLDHMEPHTALTLDFDWFARKPLNYVVTGCSSILVYLQQALASVWKNFYTIFQRLSNDPYRVVGKKPMNEVRANSPLEQKRPDAYRVEIGFGMIGIVVTVLGLIWLLRLM